ncbi:MAG TPA: Mur ligase family protein [Actinomycetota bacterium]|nr:Mur ligase family protein [Actinomycetota bacterium]
MSWAEASAHLDALGVDAMKSLKPSLHRIEAICEALDHPERRVPAIQIAGTNGKSSTARIATSLLNAAGLSVATFTSPHLMSVRERLSLNGDPITEDAFGEVYDHLAPFLALVESTLGESLSYFEVLTAMFFLWASEAPVQAAVVEAGLGGRWDATNVVDASVGILTNIGSDHADLLGTDKHGVAREKAGIAKSGGVLVVAERMPALAETILAAASDAGSDVSLIGRDFDVAENRVAFGGRYLSLRTHRRTYEGSFLSLHGGHQGVNAAAALEAVTRFIPAQELAPDVVAQGLGTAFAHGRIETIPGAAGGVPVILDVAHNPEGMSALITALLEAFAFDRVIFVAGFLADKEHTGMIAEMARVPAKLLWTRARSARSADPTVLLEAARELDPDAYVFEDVTEAVDEAIAVSGEGDLICVTGSHYVVGEARLHLLGSIPAGSRPVDSDLTQH